MTATQSPIFPLCFHDGVIRPSSEATINVLSLTARYALSVFEGIRLYCHAQRQRPVPFAMGLHLQRLQRSVRTLRLAEDGLDDLEAIASELIKVNDVCQDAYLRIAVNATNSGDLGAPAITSVSMTIAAMARKTWNETGRRMRLTVSDVQRASKAVLPYHVKAISNYTGARIALLEARGRGFDSCVLTNASGMLCEAPTAILFIVKNDVVMTPPLASGCLPGITRATVLDLCRQRGLKCCERDLSASDLYNADEAFLAGTAIELTPVGEADGHILAADNPVTQELMACYFALVRGAAAPESRKRDNHVCMVTLP